MSGVYEVQFTSDDGCQSDLDQVYVTLVSTPEANIESLPGIRYALERRLFCRLVTLEPITAGRHLKPHKALQILYFQMEMFLKHILTVLRLPYLDVLRLQILNIL